MMSQPAHRRAHLRTRPDKPAETSIIRAPLLAILLLLPVVCTSLTGCTYRKVIHDGWGDFEKMADESTLEGQADKNADQQAQAYAILLDVFTGEQRVQDARMTKDWLESEQSFTDLWLRESGETLQLVRGRYDRRDSDLALHDLRDVRKFQMEGISPYAAADLVPVRIDEVMAESPLDARNHVGMFTLQIGFYDSDFGDGFRKAAVDAAKAIREDGDEAFYYHGRNVSMVMVGLFTEDDFATKEIQPGVTIDSYGPRIRELQKKYPYNLGNGRTLIERLNDRNTGEQTSFIVRIR